jgi:hypothetical protein
MIKKLVYLLVGKLDPKDIENLIYNLLPKLSKDQWEAIGNFALRFAGEVASKAAEGAVAGAINANKK